MDFVLFLITPGFGALLLGVGVALAPAMVAAWRDRVLLARGREDPALPERFAGTQGWVILSIACSVAVLVVVWQWQAVWVLPVMFVARRWVAFRLRRVLLGESWSFWLYLSYFVRTTIGLVALTFAIGVMPIIVAAADPGSARWLVALTLAALVALWQTRYVRVWLWLWQVSPLYARGVGEAAASAAGARSVRAESADGASAAGVEAVEASELVGSSGWGLEPWQGAFGEILARAKLTTGRTRVWQAGPPGAVVANAVALPGVDEANVVISRTLVERLTVEEIAAIFAHEVAHLEHFNRTRMARQRRAGFVFIATGALLVPVLDFVAPDFVAASLAVWPLILVAGLIARASRVHGNELASDRRAVELCGNPEALMSALAKLHAIARLPRRWSARATRHPSLAQRMRAIRELAGFHAPAIEQIEIFPSPSGDAFLLLDAGRLQQVSGVLAGTPHEVEALLAGAQSVRRVSYNALKSIRIVARWNRAAMLQVTERSGRRFDAPLRDADLPRLHDLLDIIEFGMPVEKPAAFFSERDIAVGLLIASIAVGQIWSLALLAVLALVKPAAEMLIGAALALSVVGVLQWIDPTGSVASNWLPAWVLVALGGAAVDVVLWRLWSGRASSAKAPAWCVAVVLGAAAIVWLHGLLQWDGSLLRLVQVARVTPAAMLLPLAAGVVVARVPVRGRRVLAAVLALAAVVPAVLTTRWFQDEIVRDPLLASSSPLAIGAGDADMIGSASSDRQSNELRLSPEGHTFAEADRDEDTEQVGDFTIRTADGKTREVRADDLQFLDDTRALLLVNDSNGLGLRVENIGDRNKGAGDWSKAESGRSKGENNSEWSLALPRLRWTRLSMSPSTQHWRVIGRDARGQVVRLQGRIGEADYDDVRWKVDERGEALVGSGNAMLMSRTDWRASLLGRLLPELAMATSRRSSFDVSLWRVRAGAPTLLARSSADIDCVEGPVDVEPTVCFAFDGIATRLWTLTADDKRVEPIGVLAGYAHPLTRGSDGTLVAWWQRHPVLVQLDPLRVRELSSIAVSRWAHAALAANHLLIGDDLARETLSIYRVQTELTRSVQR